MRLNKFLAEKTGLSRREADEKISKGEVLINDRQVSLGAQIDESDKITYRGQIIKNTGDDLTIKHTTIMLYKPVGVVCSRNGQGKRTVYDLLPKKYAVLKTVGRLDRNSSGLILLTNDGGFTYRMTHPKFFKTKAYIVKINKPLAPLHQQMIADFGVDLPDGKSRLGLELISSEADLRRLIQPNDCYSTTTIGARTDWRIIMHEGRNRQIRRTFQALGYEVLLLHRTDFGSYKLGDLRPGEYREI
jgi:23S rRNA pseudouridine2605 synthase